jgi:hypothetical protein
MSNDISKRKILSATLAVIMLLSSMIAGVPTQAEEPAKGKEAAKAEMSQYLIISPHTADECLAALDAVEAQGNDALAKWQWGCMAGNHTGYAMVWASSEQDALKMVPEMIRSKARVMKLNQFTAEQIKSFHQMH